MSRRVHRAVLGYLPSPYAPSATWVRAICTRTHRCGEASVILADGRPSDWPPAGFGDIDTPSDPVDRAVFYITKYGGCDAEHVL